MGEKIPPLIPFKSYNSVLPKFEISIHFVTRLPMHLLVRLVVVGFSLMNVCTDKILPASGLLLLFMKENTIFFIFIK